MAKLCGAPALPADRHPPEARQSAFARCPEVVYSDRLHSQRVAKDTIADDVVSELKKLLESQAMLAHMLETQHKEVITRFDQQWGLMAAEADCFTQPVLQPSAASHEEPPVPCPSVGHLPSQHEHTDLPGHELSAASSPKSAHDPNDGDLYPCEVNSNLRFVMTSTMGAKVGRDRAWDKADEAFEHQHDMKISVSGGPSWFSTLTRFMLKYGELVMGASIVLNMALICLELQIKGETKLAYEIGLIDTPGSWDDVQAHFATVELMFTILYTIELAFRLRVMGVSYLKEPLNFVDAMVVCFAALQAFFLRPLTGSNRSGFSIMVLRILKLARIIRVLKVLKFMNNFSELRILLKTILSSFFSLMWSGVLILVVVVSSGIMMFQMASLWILDDSTPEETRVWLYDHFGTWSRSAYTMFEATFSSSWTGKAVFMVFDIHGVFTIFWVFHVAVVNFALMRIVSALFLKQTMQVAAVDAEQNAVVDLKRKEKYAQMLSEIFREADSSGDGSLNAEEFSVMMVNPSVVAMFEKMDIQLQEVKQLFSVLVEDDGQADYDEFLAAALKMKNSARCIDAVQILHQIANIKKMVIKMDRQNQVVRHGMENMGMRFSTMDTATTQLHVSDDHRLVHPVALPGPTVGIAADPVSTRVKFAGERS